LTLTVGIEQESVDVSIDRLRGHCGRFCYIPRAGSGACRYDQSRAILVDNDGGAQRIPARRVLAASSQQLVVATSSPLLASSPTLLA
jgi:hypothetical protein